MNTWLCPYCSQPFSIAPGFAGNEVACPSCGNSILVPKAGEPVPPPLPTQLSTSHATTEKESKPEEWQVDGTVSIDGFEMPIYSNGCGRKWGTYPRPFRLREQLNDWLFEHGVYMFDHSHYVIDDPDSAACMYLQINSTSDGRMEVCFVSHRDHWPSTVPLQAQRMLSSAQQKQKQQQTMATVGTALGVAFLGAAMLAPKNVNVYHRRR
jgi:hypothetical protein